MTEPRLFIFPLMCLFIKGSFKPEWIHEMMRGSWRYCSLQEAPCQSSGCCIHGKCLRQTKPDAASLSLVLVLADWPRRALYAGGPLRMTNSFWTNLYSCYPNCCFFASSSFADKSLLTLSSFTGTMCKTLKSSDSISRNDNAPVLLLLDFRAACLSWLVEFLRVSVPECIPKLQVMLPVVVSLWTYVIQKCLPWPSFSCLF